MFPSVDYCSDRFLWWCFFGVIGGGPFLDLRCLLHEYDSISLGGMILLSLVKSFCVLVRDRMFFRGADGILMIPYALE